MLLLLVLILAVAVLGTLAIRGSTAELGIAGAQERGKAAFYCAEAGLNASRAWFAANLGSWPQILKGQSVPNYPFTYTVTLANGLTGTASVTMQDDVDEFPPLANDLTHDNNLSAILTSTCTISGTGVTHTLQSLFVFTGVNGNDYRYQAGHSSTHSGNEN
jgi:hypothetical protein